MLLEAAPIAGSSGAEWGLIGERGIGWGEVWRGRLEDGYSFLLRLGGLELGGGFVGLVLYEATSIFIVILHDVFLQLYPIRPHFFILAQHKLQHTFQLLRICLPESVYVVVQCLPMHP